MCLPEHADGLSKESWAVQLRNNTGQRWGPWGLLGVFSCLLGGQQALVSTFSELHECGLHQGFSRLAFRKGYGIGQSNSYSLEFHGARTAFRVPLDRDHLWQRGHRDQKGFLKVSA